MSTVTVRLSKDLDAKLNRLAEQTGRSKSDLIREALRRQPAITQFEWLRGSVAPFADAQEWLTDEDVFRSVS